MAEKIKIAIIGVGSSGSLFVDKLSKENNSDDIKYVAFSEHNTIDQLKDNPKVETIETTRAKSIKLYNGYKLCCQNKKDFDRFEMMRNLMKDGDKLFEIYPTNSGCLQFIRWKGIKLKRDDKTIDFFRIESLVSRQTKEKKPAEQKESSIIIKKRWHDKILNLFK